MICSSCCDAPTSPPRKRSPRPTPSSTPTAFTVRPPSRPRLSHTGSPAPRRGPRPAGHGGIRVLPDHLQAVRAFLDPLPVGELYGVGPIQAATLEQYGLKTVGRLASRPLQTIQRILGGREGRLAHERARGIDSRPVIPSELPPSISVRRILDREPSTRTWCAPKSSTPWWTSPISSASAIRSPRASLSACPAPVAECVPIPDPGRAERIPRRPTGHGAGSGSNVSDWSGPRYALHPALRACAIGGLQRSHGHACRIRSVSRGHPPG